MFWWQIWPKELTWEQDSETALRSEYEMESLQVKLPEKNIAEIDWI